MRIRLMILIALAVFLVWEIVTRGVASYLAEESPEMATVLRASEATALLNMAQRKLRDLNPKKVEPVANSHQASPDAHPEGVQRRPEFAGNQSLAPNSDTANRSRAEIRSLAERALVQDPLNSRALPILGQLSIQIGDDKRARAFMQAAVRRSLFESEAVYWMMQKSYETRDYKAAIEYADVLLKTHQNVLGHVMPILGRVAEQDSTGGLKKLLASNPPWRGAFFSALPGNISDARTPLEIFLSLKNMKTPPTNAELRSYLNFLIDHKFYDLAYYTWLQFLPAPQMSKVGNLFNGNFELNPSGLPFDWVWTEQPAVTIEIASLPDQEKARALQIEFGVGRVDFSGIAQLIMLPPGSYQFQGKYKADIISQRGLQWRISCAAGEGSLGESSMVAGHDSTWQDLQFSFTVPQTNCPAQYVTLISGARSASEQFISGTIWYQDLKIVNESVVAPSQEPL